jgi:hypothetical protein
MNAQILQSSYANKGFTVTNLDSRVHLKHAMNTAIDYSTMSKGYELMADINLGFSEMGLFDFLTGLSQIENLLNGDDN